MLADFIQSAAEQEKPRETRQASAKPDGVVTYGEGDKSML